MNLNIFNTANLFEAATNLFQQLNIKLNSNTAEPLPVKDLLKQHYKDNDTFKTISKTYFIGIIDNTVFQATGMFDVNYSYKEALQQGDKNYDGLMLFALELSKQPTRTEISDLTRTFNRISQKMPVALVLKYKTGNEACFSIAISERFKYKQNWRQGEKAGKVIILRDIHTVTTHAGHERILLDLVKPVGVTNYDQLHQHWLQVLDVNILNKKFFQDLANWYFWAMDNVSFPDDLEKKKDVRNATNLIRLITRVVFIWFIKEKSLVPNDLFNKAYLDKILKDFNKNKKSQNYYHAILQNLFFGTLNQKMDERKFAKDGDFNTNKKEFLVKNIYRYAGLFNISEKEVIALFKDVPFLNGGLFDCLDKEDEQGKWVYVDGFSRNPKKRAIVPDYIFFGDEIDDDQTEYYDPNSKKPIIKKAKGLINLLSSYKFTVAENTPIEEEIALDPELLGKVFENLLASYNPETQTTARKQTGSFYTPREIVNYMVDESLLEYIKQNVKIINEDFENRLRELISYAETPNPFDENETKTLIEAINKCKILDPACGSGAYPMGILHKMVHLLQKLDPENKHWKALQRQKAMEETEAAFKIGDKEERGKRLAEINDVFENNASDYGRKLYLIENCIYGIDIQPIAVQISKLRFFISLIIDQDKQASKENFGIRSLPNLETKFVAANTLIGLDIPTHDLFAENNPIKKLENDLKNVRHEYFAASNRKEKLRLQKEDKKLRKQISELIKVQLTTISDLEIVELKEVISVEKDKLKKIEKSKDDVEVIKSTDIFGGVTETKIDKKAKKIKAQKDRVIQLEKELQVKEAVNNKDSIANIAEQIASFDPYNQNTSASWFDPEWMFGLTSGFDIVIGNPPYVNVENLEAKTKKYLFDKYATCKGRTDIYIAFIEISLTLLKQNGIFSYIIPYPYTNQNYGSLSRKLLIDKYFVKEILDTSEYYVFETAAVKNIILSTVKGKNKGNTSIKIAKSSSDFIDNSFVQYIQNQNLFLELKDYRFETKDISLALDLKSKIWSGSIRFDEICLIAYGARINHKSENIGKDYYIHDSFKKGYKPFTEGKNIDRYGYSQYGWLNYKPEEHYNSMFTELFENEKIFFINIVKDRLRFAFDKDSFYNSHTVINCVKWDLLKKVSHITVRRNITIEKILKASSFNYKFLLGILNSNLINWYFLNFLSESLHFYPDDAKELPINNLELKKQIPFIIIVDFIIQNKKENIDTSFFERLIDAAVYELYFPQEIKKSGAGVLKHLTNLPELKEGQDEKNLKTIEKVYKELSDPKHPISAALLKLLTIEEVNIIEERK